MKTVKGSEYFLNALYIGWEFNAQAPHPLCVCVCERGREGGRYLYQPDCQRINDVMILKPFHNYHFSHALMWGGDPRGFYFLFLTLRSILLNGVKL